MIVSYKLTWVYTTHEFILHNKHRCDLVLNCIMAYNQTFSPVSLCLAALTLAKPPSYIIIII